MKYSYFAVLPAVLALSAAVPAPALAWGNFAHTEIGEIAWNLLTQKARTEVERLLASSHDSLTKNDFPHRATWADQQRLATHGATEAWHFVNTPYNSAPTDEREIEARIESVCHRQVLRIPAASDAAPTNECVVAKIDEFEKDLAAPSTPADEKVLALFFLEHFIGDVSQPLHAISNDDAGGNCVTVSYGRKTTKLHSYWDDQAAFDAARGFNSIKNGDALTASVTKEDIRQWYGGTADQWAADSYRVAVSAVYKDLTPGPLPTCANENVVPIQLSDVYRVRAAETARRQVIKAGIRLAYAINSTLGK